MASLSFDTKTLNDVVSRYRQLLRGFTPGQKAVTVATALAVIIGGIFLFTRASSPSYTTLFANLQATQAGQVTQKLTADHVPYQLADNGATVLVPQADVNQERISLAESGLPSGGTITFQTLASTGITSSEFVQNVDYQQALEGQLAQTIESIQGVQNAQVSLVMPDTDTFAVSNTQTPSASVLLSLNPGTTLTTEQVQGVVHLVASAVPDLDSQDVTVVDSAGNVLSAPGVDTAANQDQAETLTYDANLAQAITAILTPVVGANNAAVQVHAVLNFDQVSTQTNGLQAGANGQPVSLPTSQSTTRETFNGTGAQAAGVLGAGTPANATANTPGNYTQTETQTTTSVGQQTQSIVQAPGQVQQTSVAVIVNRRAAGANNLAQLRNTIAAAAGLNLRGADRLVVSAIAFSPTATSQPTVANILTRLRTYAPALALVVVLAALFVLALRNSRKRGEAFEQVVLASPAFAAAPLGSGIAGAPHMAFGDGTWDGDGFGEEHGIGLPAGGGIALPQQVIAGLTAAIDPVPEDVEQYIRENPEEVAQLMRMWTGERAAGR